MTDGTTSTWTIDPADTAVGFAAEHMMFPTVRGRFTDVKGTCEVDRRSRARSTVNVEIAAVCIEGTDGSEAFVFGVA